MWYYDNPSHKCDGTDTFLPWSLDGVKVFFYSTQSGADTFLKSKNGFVPARGYNKFCLVPYCNMLGESADH